MLPRANRLNKRAFETIFKTGKLASSPFFVVRYVKSSDEIPHFSVVVPKSIAKKAHLRNRLRRLYYGNLGSLGSKPLSCIVFLKKEALSLDQSSIGLEFSNLLKKMNI
jgi:ribonuclease P protein component